MAPRKYTLQRRLESIAETRDRIIQATFELHAEKGVVETSMQDIADRADVALRTVYNHYPTVDDLVAGCGGKVMTLLAPPEPRILDGVDSLEERIRTTIGALFAMYERGAAYIEVGRREHERVPALSEYVAGIAATRDSLVREALRPFRPSSVVVRRAAALADFWVWKAFAEQGVTTYQAIDIIARSLVAVVVPDDVGMKGTAR